MKDTNGEEEVRTIGDANDLSAERFKFFLFFFSGKTVVTYFAVSV